MWIRSKTKEQEYEGLWFEQTQIFDDKFKYRLLCCLDRGRLYVMLANGNKRKYLDTFDDQTSKKTSSIKPLLWVRERILNLESELPSHIIKQANKIVIGYADSRRRVVYKRGLISHGFREARIQGAMCLVKDIK